MLGGKKKVVCTELTNNKYFNRRGQFWPSDTQEKFWDVQISTIIWSAPYSTILGIEYNQQFQSGLPNSRTSSPTCSSQLAHHYTEFLGRKACNLQVTITGDVLYPLQLISQTYQSMCHKVWHWMCKPRTLSKWGSNCGSRWNKRQYDRHVAP